MINKKAAILLIACTAVNMLFSCGANTDIVEKETQAFTTASETESMPEIEALDGGGRDFVILNREVSESYNSHPIAEFAADEQNGEIINDAVYTRNLFLEEKYNIKIVSENSSATGADMKSKVIKACASGDDLYSVIALALNESFALASQGFLYDIKSIPHIDPSKPWWMESAMKESSVKGKNHYIVGDMNLGAFNTATCLFFNKKPITDLHLDNPYILVKENKWTMDKLSEMCKAYTTDINGDGVIDHNDRFGLSSSSYAWQVFFYGCGSIFVKKDAGDVPYFPAIDERTYNVIMKIINLSSDPTCTINVTQVKNVPSIVQLQMDMFAENRCIFMINNIYGTIPLRSVETEYGILPNPKYDSNQDDYISSMHASNATAMCVPITNDNTDLAGRILEDMAYQSYNLVRPAYYDITLKTKFALDNESQEMLDIIFNKLIIDPVLIMWTSGQGVDGLFRNALTNNDVNIISQIEANIDSYNATIKTAVENFN
ncbi:MAG: hypothetical protein FWF15_06415 [Oscillospiraceae bacterium]|nr:hypothetical protein [Oscillospiraceae bacterium]